MQIGEALNACGALFMCMPSGSAVQEVPDFAKTAAKWPPLQRTSMHHDHHHGKGFLSMHPRHPYTDASSSPIHSICCICCDPQGVITRCDHHGRDQLPLPFPQSAPITARWQYMCHMAVACAVSPRFLETPLRCMALLDAASFAVAMYTAYMCALLLVDRSVPSVTPATQWTPGMSYPLRWTGLKGKRLFA